MLKYVDTALVFQEIPDETTLALSLSNCPCRCPGCHSRYLWDDVGTPLDDVTLEHLLQSQGVGVSCVCFMGGDSAPNEVQQLAEHLHAKHPKLRVAWYTGRPCVSSDVDRNRFDYIKVGPYIAHLGPLTSPKTNQRLLKKQPDNSWTDITPRFWRHQSR